MNNLKKIRESRNMTQEQAGELCLVQRGYISRLESGDIGLTEDNRDHLLRASMSVAELLF